jgi:hypothetical protein
MWTHPIGSAMKIGMTFYFQRLIPADREIPGTIQFSFHERGNDIRKIWSMLNFEVALPDMTQVC